MRLSRKYEPGDFVEFKYLKEGIVGEIIAGGNSNVIVKWENCEEPQKEDIEYLRKLDWAELKTSQNIPKNNYKKIYRYDGTDIGDGLDSYDKTLTELRYAVDSV